MQKNSQAAAFARVASWVYVGASGIAVLMLIVFGGPMGLPFEPAYLLRLGPCSFVYWAFGFTCYFAAESQTIMGLFTGGVLLVFWIGLLAQLRLMMYVGNVGCFLGLCVAFLLEWLVAAWYLYRGWDSSIDGADIAWSVALGCVGLFWCVAFVVFRRMRSSPSPVPTSSPATGTV